MRTDTLSYNYQYQGKLADVYRVLIAEQTKYFKSHNSGITALKVGTTITPKLPTKMHKLPSSSTMEVVQLVPEKIFQMKTTSTNGEILQTYEFTTKKNGRQVLTYSEQNTFDRTRDQYNFMMVGILYKLFYNRGIAKRLKYLDSLAQKS